MKTRDAGSIGDIATVKKRNGTGIDESNVVISIYFYFLHKGDYIYVLCPKCSNNVYSHHQKINKYGTEIKRNYACRKCKYVFETIKQIIVTDKEVSK